jgi:methyl-accepting chemotaxis protein
MKMPSFSNHSLRSLMLGGGVLAALTPALILGMGSAVEVGSMIHDDRLDDQLRLAQSLAQRLDESLVLHQQAIGALANVVGKATWLDETIINPDLQAFDASFPGFNRLYVIDPNARVVASFPVTNGQSAVGQNYSDRDYVQEVLRTRKPLITRDVLLGASGSVVETLLVPIMQGNDLKAIAAGTIIMETLQETLGSLRRQNTGHVVVTTAKGRVLADEDFSLVKQGLDFSKYEIWSHIGGQDSGKIDRYTDENGLVRLASFATVPSTGWKVWASQTRAEVNDQIVQTYRSVLLWFVAAIVLALVSAWMLAGRVFRPIESLRRTATEITAGDLGKRAPEEGPSELATLARTMNLMAETQQRTLVAEQAMKSTLEKAVADYGAVAARVASGDLQARVTASGGTEIARLGDSLNRMFDSLARMVGEIRSATTGVASAVSEILAATSQQVSATAEEATAVRQTATTVAEVRQTAELAARKTRAVLELAQRTAGTAEDGRRAVDETVAGSEEAKTRMEALAERILSFSEQAEAIAEINAMVSELAGQSNLLAVNAGIEAAKAGEAGRGFAVVAAEVKALAERCKDATAQVRRIVGEIQKSAQATVIAAEQGVKAAEAGAGTAQRSGNAIASLSQSVSEASQAAQQIMAAAEQQESGMDQIALAMQNIEQSSTQTVATMQQVEAAAQNLDGLAKNLTALILSATSGR